MIERIPTIIMVALLCQGHLFSQVIFVNGQSTAGAPDGSSWEMAFRGLEDALAIAQYGDQIWMAKGTYRPPGTNGRDSRYEIPSGVQILGGFSGSEGQVSDRDFINNIVELSGDIGIVGDPSDNCYTVVFLEDVDSTTTLDGLVIADGIATFGDVLEPFKSPRTNGGGLYIGSNLIPSLPRVRNCTFRNCSAIRSGGAVFCAALDVAGRVGPRFVDCRFEANTATERGGGLFISTGNQHDGAPLN
ncbi:MAG: hypothetical protein R3301_06015, partial [Saprospiraceae bacterium]|nr:hypothetical protein [Saprospiraceae bacterium]